jgi:hypothetical protein
VDVVTLVLVDMLTFSASDQAAPLAPVLFGVLCSVSDMLITLQDLRGESELLCG